jgi:hypothetical protein
MHILIKFLFICFLIVSASFQVSAQKKFQDQFPKPDPSWVVRIENERKNNGGSGRYRAREP